MENGQPQEPGLSLSNILEDDSIEQLERHQPADGPAEGWDEETTENALEDGYCVECEGMCISPTGFDAQLEPVYCPMIQTNQHMCIVNPARTTFARFVLWRNIAKDPGNSTRLNRLLWTKPRSHRSSPLPRTVHRQMVMRTRWAHSATPPPISVPNALSLSQMDVEGVDSDEELERASQAGKTLKLEPQPVIGGNVGEWFVERSKYIPMRLTLSERKYLRLLEAALNVSEYVGVERYHRSDSGHR
jgi:hypothetical protein